MLGTKVRFIGGASRIQERRSSIGDRDHDGSVEVSVEEWLKEGLMIKEINNGQHSCWCGVRGISSLMNKRVLGLLGALLMAVGVFVVPVVDRAEAQPAEGSAELYASPSGKAKTCKAKNPCSLEQAQQQVRAYLSGEPLNGQRAPGDIVVYLRGGTYELDSTLEFDARDSGREGTEVVYRNYQDEVPVLSGGRTVTDWTPADDGLWVADVGDLDTRQLFVDGERAVRARSAENPSGFEKTGRGYRAPDDSMASWDNVDDIEILSNVLWKSFRCGVAQVEGRELIMDQPCWDNANMHTNGGTLAMGAITWIENALELLDEPGEFYLDRSLGRLYYMPRPGEDMATAEVVAPVLETLVEGQGTLDAPLEHVRFQGLTFAHTTWLGPEDPNEGYADVQAGFRIVGDNTGKTFRDTQWGGEWGRGWEKTPSAVSFRAAHDVVFERNTFTRLGSGGLNLEFGSQRNRVVGNAFRDVAGTGVTLGDIKIEDHHPQDARSVIKDNRITNNFITRIGQEFFGSVGIWSGYTQDTLIAHNELTDLPYTAISSGWGWGLFDPGGNRWFAAYSQGYTQYSTPTTLRNVRIANNLIHDIENVNEDGGGIYTLSAHPGSSITGNVVRDVGGPRYRMGLYLDDGSRYLKIRHNVVYDACDVALTKGGDDIITNNFWDALHTQRGSLYYRGPCSKGVYLDYYNYDGPTRYADNQQVLDPNVMPASIVSNAGPQPPYRDLRSEPPPDDQEPPSAPGQPTAVATTGEAVLTWDQSQDNVGVTAYEIHRDGELVGVSAVPEFIATGLQPGTTYTFRVFARDAAANQSAASPSVTVTALEKPNPNGENLALGKTATAYYIDGRPARMQALNPARDAVDGNLSTWAQATGEYRWQLQVDLGSVKNVARAITYMPLSNYATDFEISTSTDGETFTTVRSVSGFGGGASTEEFAPTSARYVRVVAIKPDGPAQQGLQMGIAELELYSE